MLGRDKETHVLEEDNQSTTMDSLPSLLSRRFFSLSMSLVAPFFKLDLVHAARNHLAPQVIVRIQHLRQCAYATFAQIGPLLAQLAQEVAFPRTAFAPGEQRLESVEAGYVALHRLFDVRLDRFVFLEIDLFVLQHVVEFAFDAELADVHVDVGVGLAAWCCLWLNNRNGGNGARRFPIGVNFSVGVGLAIISRRCCRVDGRRLHGAWGCLVDVSEWIGHWVMIGRRGAICLAFSPQSASVGGWFTS
ncbi:hypothetical protein IWX49DRAFT_359124 [Phyllosticta citricarpa]|uniref:Uncharacterized protein n=1 Tax=Phyllosticta paracitricarpa TaxID=2016321 RepID=A0ABR1MW71_9PEZI